MATRSFKRIKVIDDDPAVREGYGTLVEISEREPVIEDGPLGTLEGYLARTVNADAAISDHRLRPRNYAYFDGIELVAAWYKRGTPALLCTTFDKSNVIPFRKWRPWVPIVMSAADLNPDSLVDSLELVAREIEGDFLAPRRPWRAQVHFVEVDRETSTAYAKVPGWSQEALAFRLHDLPATLQAELTTQPDYRCHAKANLGAEAGDDLYVMDWEL